MNLTNRINKRDHREAVTPTGDLVIARRQEGDLWLVTAHPADLSVQVQGTAFKNEAGFRGRQWESAIDGQQHSSLRAVMEAAVEQARRGAATAALKQRLGAS